MADIKKDHLVRKTAAVCVDQVTVELMDNLGVSTPVKKMERGISRANDNEYLVHLARNKVERDFGGMGKVDVSDVKLQGLKEDVVEHEEPPTAFEETPRGRQVIS